ncbi:MAG: preprotein translocase subunit SecG [Planctomycetes bacterium]|nr:preprotein translocase subunit SecG [Planctomycetota bacterium]MCB9918821.1 preprotein translocase subunit SecG [Planctomycetota bacterium]
MAIIKLLLWLLFFVSSFLMIVVILLQEPKGGGLAEAFGGMGAQTFGVKSGGINKFTFTLFAVFLGSAVLITILRWQ